MQLPHAAVPPTPASASINRIRVVDLPGLPVNPEVRGEQAYHLLSAPALIRYAQAAGEALALPEALRAGDPASPEVRRSLPRLVDERLRHPNPVVRDAALAIARRLGRNLGYILLTLQRGDAVNRAARPDWPSAAWDDWARIRHVWLGGGIMSGELGTAIIGQANALLAEVATMDGSPRMTVERTPRPHDMAILGAARYLPGRPEATWRALCLDLGQTSAKRGVAAVEGDAVTRFAWLPPVPVRWQWRNDPDAKEAIDGREVLRFVAEAVAGGLWAVDPSGPPLAQEVSISIAAYTHGGTLLGNGIYARMHQLGDDARLLIADRVAELSDVRPRLTILHDGTAAATLHAGEPNRAVIVVGTALGVGFPPPDEAGLLKVGKDLTVGDL